MPDGFAFDLDNWAREKSIPLQDNVDGWVPMKDEMFSVELMNMILKVKRDQGIRLVPQTTTGLEASKIS
jgi:hypothetical protein